MLLSLYFLALIGSGPLVFLVRLLLGERHPTLIIRESMPLA